MSDFEMYIHCACVLVTQSCPTLYNPMDCSLVTNVLYSLSAFGGWFLSICSALVQLFSVIGENIRRKWKYPVFLSLPS